MIIASIDIGSNSLILLIVEFHEQSKNFKVISQQYKYPRISKNINKTNIISDESIKNLIDDLFSFRKIILNNNCNTVFVKCTNAFRLAKNGNEILVSLKEIFGWNFEIISGEEEAFLSFIGTIVPEYLNTKVTLIDIGGGSTEIISGNIDSIEFVNSFQIGIVSCFEKYVRGNTIKSATSEIETEIKEIIHKKKIIIDKTSKLISISGTPTTIACILSGIKDYDEKMIENFSLKLNVLKETEDMLANMTSIEIKNTFGKIVEGREDLLSTGVIILRSFMELFEINEIMVSGKGLRFGTIIQYLLNNYFIKKEDLSKLRIEQ